MARDPILGLVALWCHLRFCGAFAGVLRFLGERVVILEENFLDVTLHRYVAGPISMLGMIVPSEVDAGKKIPFPLCGDIVVLLYGLQKM